MSLARRFGVRPATFVALGSLVVGMVLVDRKIAELETRLDEISSRTASAATRLDVAGEAENSAPAPAGATARNQGAIPNQTGGAGAEVDDVPNLADLDVEVVGWSEPLPEAWERRRPFGSGLRPAYRDAL